MEGLDLSRRRFPKFVEWFAGHPVTVALARGLEWCMRVAGMTKAMRA
jgi:hypothetical protein